MTDEKDDEIDESEDADEEEEEEEEEEEDEGDEDEGDEDDDDDGDSDDGDSDEDEHDASTGAAVAAPSAVTAEPEIPRRRARMAKEDQLGPRPPMATHWRCRRMEDDGRKPTLLFHNDGDGFAVCEWPIRTCTPETIRERWGAVGGSFVVQFIQTDANGTRRPCGRSRLLVLTPPTRPERAPEPPPPAPPPPAYVPMASPPMASPPMASPPMAGPPMGDSFTQMFSLLAYMQDRDEKLRAAAREEARLANDRYKADIELMMERDRLAAKERVAQIEATARAAGRAIGAPGSDAEFLAQRIGEVVGTKLEGVYDEDDDPPPPAAAPAQGGEAALAAITSIATALGPILPQVVQFFQGHGPPNPNPGSPPTTGGGHGPH